MFIYDRQPRVRLLSLVERQAAGLVARRAPVCSSSVGERARASDNKRPGISGQTANGDSIGFQ